MNRHLVLIVLSACTVLTGAFSFQKQRQAKMLPFLRMSSYSVDSSDYSSKDSDFENEEDDIDDDLGSGRMNDDEEANVVELKPVPMSKNAGNRFLAILWDRMLDKESRSLEELHEDRIKQTEPHVMACRKANLYNDTFNTDSMVDVVWSRQM